MTASPIKANDDEALSKLNELRRKSFREQAMWFLNTSPVGENPEKCKSVRRIEQKCADIESSSDYEENSIDEFTAHRLLEYANNPCSASELRNFVDGIHGSKRRRVSLAELLIFTFGDDWRTLVNSPDCCDLIAERRAKKNLDELKAELENLLDKARDGARAAENARQAEKVAIEKEVVENKSAEDARRAELASRELLLKEEQCLESLDKLEQTTSQLKADLEAIVSDSTKGIVTRNKANAELAILLSQDPSSLRAGRIKQEAVTRKSSDALVKSKQALINAERALHLARAARAEAHKQMELAIAAAKAAEDAIPAAQQAFEKASRTLEEITKKHLGLRGTIFYINADLSEQKKYLPNSHFVVAQRRASEALQSVSSSSLSSS